MAISIYLQQYKQQYQIVERVGMRETFCNGWFKLQLTFSEAVLHLISYARLVFFLLNNHLT